MSSPPLLTVAAIVMPLPRTSTVPSAGTAVSVAKPQAETISLPPLLTVVLVALLAEVSASV